MADIRGLMVLGLELVVVDDVVSVCVTGCSAAS